LNQPDSRVRRINRLGGLGVDCDAAGLRLAGVALLHKRGHAFVPRPADEIELLLKAAYPADKTPFLSLSLASIADALNAGNLAKAAMTAVFLKLPELDADGAARIARVDDVLAKYDGQPRAQDGRFADGKMGAAAHHDRPPAQSAKPSSGPHQTSQQTLTHVATAADFATRKTPADAPGAIQFSPTLQGQFDVSWSRSFPGGRSKEQGGTIVTDRQGNLSVQNIGGVAADRKTFTPDYTMKDPAKFTPIGVFHTHPYDRSEGGYTGIAIDGGDAGGLIDSPAKFCVVQSGEKQFMFMKTSVTPQRVNWDALHMEGQRDSDAFGAKGNNFADSSAKAAIEIAAKYGLAYYEGHHGHFTRVYQK